MKKNKLTDQEKRFARCVQKAIFANPFGPDRRHADLEISGLTEICKPAVILERVVENVQSWTRDFIAHGGQSVQDFSGTDRELVEAVFLFDAFHRFIAPLDAHIEDQIREGDEPVHVPFGTELLKLLYMRGFPRPTAVQYLALFFQMRRAFFFIHHGLVGQSPCMQALRLGLWNNVFTGDIGLYARRLITRMEDFSTLLLGETGTGKGAAASAIGRSGFIPFDERSGRFRESFLKAFVSINLSQYPESIIESELFGHRKGAFTGAVEAHKGVFAQCSPHGAIFLDEIGEVAIPVQIKLLRVLQERTFLPVGSHAAQRFCGRVIAATNRSLPDLMETGAFRDDFFYRLCSDVILLPPLRQRIQEDPLELDRMVRLTLKRILGEPVLLHSQRETGSEELAESVKHRIIKDLGLQYDWPGNVRELEQCIRRILMTGRSSVPLNTGCDDLETRLARRTRTADYTAENLLVDYCSLVYERTGSYQETARRLGLDRRTVKKYVDAGNAGNTDS